MIIGLFPRPVVCGWCGYPVITALGLDPSCIVRPLSAPDPAGPLPPSCPVLPGARYPGWPKALCPVSSGSPCPLGDLVEGLASLLWVCCALGPSFPNYLLHCNSWWSGSLLFVRNSCTLYLNAFVLNIAHFCSAILGDIIFLELIQALVHWTLPYCVFSHCSRAV